MKQLLIKHKAIILYVLFGGLTTLTNILSYLLFAHALNFGVMPSTILAFIISVLFAYLTNRKWVFESKAKGKEILTELVKFFLCRFATGIFDFLCMYVLVDLLQFNDVIIKILSNVIVIILNFVASKLLVFNKK